MIKMIVTITHTILSSKRTKDRIKQHGPEFFLKKTAVDVFGFMGVECSLLESTKDDWFGWIPTNEFNVKSVKESIN